MTRDPVVESPDTGDLVGGRYRIDGLIGRGGMAAVYRAHDVTLGRAVALKLFAQPGEAAADDGRKTSEIRLLASLKHPALVTLFDASDGSGDAGGPAFMAMELVEGPTLTQSLAAGPFASKDVERLGIDLAEALHVVHAAGIVHRDIKPSNVLLEESSSPGRSFHVKLADFGIAYVVDATRLTLPGTLVGTAAYLSPEQAKGEPPTPSSDVYSLGLVLLEALTGERAFPGTMIESATARLLRDPVVPASVGVDWRRLLTRMTSRDATQRPDALTVARAIHDFTGASGASGAAAAVSVTDGEATARIEAATRESAVPVPTKVLSMDAEARTAATAAGPRSDAEATTVLTSPAGAGVGMPAATDSSGRAPRSAASRGSRRALILIAVVVVLLVAAVVIALVVSSMAGGGAEQTPLPDIPGPLGVHLQQLRDEVNP